MRASCQPLFPTTCYAPAGWYPFPPYPLHLLSFHFLSLYILWLPAIPLFSFFSSRHPVVTLPLPHLSSHFPSFSLFSLSHFYIFPGFSLSSTFLCSPFPTFYSFPSCHLRRQSLRLFPLLRFCQLSYRALSSLSFLPNSLAYMKKYVAKFSFSFFFLFTNCYSFHFFSFHLVSFLCLLPFVLLFILFLFISL